MPGDNLSVMGINDFAAILSSSSIRAMSFFVGPALIQNKATTAHRSNMKVVSHSNLTRHRGGGEYHSCSCVCKSVHITSIYQVLTLLYRSARHGRATPNG